MDGPKGRKRVKKKKKKKKKKTNNCTIHRHREHTQIEEEEEPAILVVQKTYPVALDQLAVCQRDDFAAAGVELRRRKPPVPDSSPLWSLDLLSMRTEWWWWWCFWIW